MKKKIIFVFLLVILFFSTFTLAQAQSAQDAINGLNKTADGINAFKGQTSESFGSDFLATKTGQIIGLVLSFIGAIFLVLMVYAGITWMTSQGNEQQVTKAKSLIINSVIGIIIVFAAYAITTFIGSEILK